MLACYTQNSVKNDQHENWQVFLSLEKPFMREAKLVIAKFVLLIQAEKKLHKRQPCAARAGSPFRRATLIRTKIIHCEALLSVFYERTR